MRRPLLALALLAASVGAPAPAHAAPLSLTASLGTTGWIDLHVTGRPGSTVAIDEEGAGHVADVPLASDSADRRRAAQWRCDRRRRTFTATADDETATAQIRTPSCRDRLAFATRPFAPRAGRRVLVRVRDHWRLGGFTTRVCLGTRCRNARIKANRATKTVLLTARPAGLRTLSVTAPWGRRLKQLVDVRRGPLKLLATGDSMIQILDGFLKDRLRPRGVRVASDARISTGISKPFMLDWVALARRQALARRPNVTVVFIGANDGFAIGGVDCCGPKWIAGYARRVRRMMGSYRRRGAARVYWLTLPAPSKPSFARVFRAVNAALRQAAPALRHSGRIIDTGRVFTPGGRFRSSIGGHVVRQADGVHLNVRGASIAAGLVIRALRRDGVLAG